MIDGVEFNLVCMMKVMFMRMVRYIMSECWFTVVMRPRGAESCSNISR